MEVISFIHLGKWGQCGNQLFEIAGVLGLCKRYGATPAFPVDWKYRNDFNIPYEYFKNVKPDFYISGHQKGYNRDLLENAKQYRNVNITEYLQSEKYFFEIRDKIKHYLTPKGTKYLGDNSVGIHIRRGDYVGHPYFYQLEPLYYLSAIKQYCPGTSYKFFVCSDDPDFCRSHFIGDQFIIEERNEIDDLRILAGCRHHIIANSTFSWWGAYLSKSIMVIRPPKIFAGLYSKIRDEAGYWPEEWIINDSLKQEIPDSLGDSLSQENLKTIYLPCLKKCVDLLFLNSSFLRDYGLMHGKMGISIFFYHFSRKTENVNYEQFAGELLDDVFEAISDKTSSDFENGFAGIGWGIEYLVRNGFAEGNTDEILSDIDQKLLKKLLSGSGMRMSMKKGLIGIGVFFLSRIKIVRGNDGNPDIIKNEQLIVQFLKLIDRRTVKKNQLHKLFRTEEGLFDFSSDYMILICLMAEIFELNICREISENILCNLLMQLVNEDKMPLYQINRLLLIRVIEKLKRCQVSGQVKSRNKEVINNVDLVNPGLDDLLVLVSEKLHLSFNIDELNLELSSVDFGSNGFHSCGSWLFQKIFNLPDLPYSTTPRLWSSLTEQVRKSFSEQISLIIEKNREVSLGLSDGLAGQTLQFIHY
jgi:hypothetical protein